MNQTHTYLILTKNFKIEKIIHARHKNRKFMLNIILNFQEMTNISIKDKTENNDYLDKNENNLNY